MSPKKTTSVFACADLHSEGQFNLYIFKILLKFGQRSNVSGTSWSNVREWYEWLMSYLKYICCRMRRNICFSACNHICILLFGQIFRILKINIYNPELLLINLMHHSTKAFSEYVTKHQMGYTL